MSIIVSVKVRDGIVFGADSMASYYDFESWQEKKIIVKSYYNVQKLFFIADRAAVMVHGIGNIGHRSIGNYIHEYKSIVAKEDNIEGMANVLFDLLRDQYSDGFADVNIEDRPNLGVFIGGYSKGSHLAEEWEFRLPGYEEPILVQNKNSFGANWRGVARPFTRLYTGIDPQFANELMEQRNLKDDMPDLKKKYRSTIMFHGMPVQDAVNFAAFILQTTINFSTFEVGYQSCGGPLWLGAIKGDTEKYQWINKPELRMGLDNEGN